MTLGEDTEVTIDDFIYDPETNDGNFSADLVVSNADPSMFYEKVLHRTPSKISNKPSVLKHSMSLFVIYFSTKKIYLYIC